MLSSSSGPAPPNPVSWDRQAQKKERARIRHQKMAGLSNNIVPGAARRSSRLLLQDLDNVRNGRADAARPGSRSRTTRPRFGRSRGGGSSSRGAVERLARVAQAPGLKKLRLALVLRIRIYRIHMIFGPPGSGFISQRYGYRPDPAIIKQK